MTDSIAVKADEVAQLARSCGSGEDAELCEKLQMAVGELDAAAREAFQAGLRETFLGIADKLEEGKPLDAAEKGALDELVVGVAQRYLASEDDVQEWRGELERLAGELEGIPKEDPPRLESLLRIQALCAEAARVVPDLQFYLVEKERVARYDASSETIDPEEGRMVARMIRDLVKSERR